MDGKTMQYRTTNRASLVDIHGTTWGTYLSLGAGWK